MADTFTPIETQEQLDGIITERLKREREATAKKYAGWISPEEAEKARKELENSVKRLTEEAEKAKTTIAGHEASIKRYQAAELRSKIADEVGLDRRLVNRLTGDTEEALKADAESLKALFGTTAGAGELGSTEGSGINGGGSLWSGVAAQIIE